MQEVNSAILEDSERYVANPLAMFPIRKRLALEWPDVLNNITNCSMVHDYPGAGNMLRSHLRHTCWHKTIELYLR